MTDEQILKYLRDNAQYPQETLVAQLRTSGFPEADIQAALVEMDINVSPSPIKYAARTAQFDDSIDEASSGGLAATIIAGLLLIALAKLSYDWGTLLASAKIGNAGTEFGAMFLFPQIAGLSLLALTMVVLFNLPVWRKKHPSENYRIAIILSASALAVTVNFLGLPMPLFALYAVVLSLCLSGLKRFLLTAVSFGTLLFIGYIVTTFH